MKEKKTGGVRPPVAFNRTKWEGILEKKNKQDSWSTVTPAIITKKPNEIAIEP